MLQKKYIIFSDLDGTLLDHNTYSFAAAVDALKLTRKKDVTLVLVSSKTKTEMVYYQKILSLENAPFVVENGAAVFTPPDYFSDLGGHQEYGNLWCYQYGPHYQELVKILNEISGKYAHPIKGFHNASVEEIAEKTGLSDERLITAMEREFSVPLFFDHVTEQVLKKEISDYELRILHGGRFMHVLGNLDKGTAVKMLIRAYRRKYPSSELSIMAIGDSENDLAMLAHANYPALVKKPGGEHEIYDTDRSVHLSPLVGPAGWNEAVIKFLSDGGKNE